MKAQEAIDTAITQAPYWIAGVGGILAFFDHHSKGILAMVAVASFCVSWYYQHKNRKK